MNFSQGKFLVSRSLGSQSMTTRMAVKLEDKGSCSMKSIEMEFQGFSRIGSCLSSLWGQ